MVTLNVLRNPLRVKDSFLIVALRPQAFEMEKWYPQPFLSIYCGWPWSAGYINFMQNTHQIQVLTKPLCRAQAIFYSLPNNEWGTKYHGLIYSAK